jgi:phosphoglycolate phosphatase
MRYHSGKKVNPDIIFDLDGTLIDSQSSIINSLRVSAENLKVDLINELDSSIIGPPLNEMFRNITGIDDKDILEQLTREFKEVYDTAGYKQCRPFEGIDECISTLHNSGYNLHLATNKRINPTRKILDYFDWGTYFKTVYAIDRFAEVYLNKSSMIKAQLSTCKLSADAAIYVGDRSDDADAAHANRLRFCYVSWGYGTMSDMVLNEDDVVINSTIELLQTVMRCS